MARSSVPMASVMAFITAGGAPYGAGLAAAFHAERVAGHGVFEVETLNDGRSPARGMV